MADCIEFYDDWGSGDNINLHIYYRMCDEILAEIKNSPELLVTNQSRYSGNLKLKSGKLHTDAKLHILLFDLIYCVYVYDLYERPVFTRPKSKEKQLIIEQTKKAKSLLEANDQAKDNAEKLEEALRYVVDTAHCVTKAKHKTYGECEIVSADEKYLRIRNLETDEKKQLSLAIVVANSIVTFNVEGVSEKVKEFIPLLKKADSIPRTLEFASHALASCEDYLD